VFPFHSREDPKRIWERRSPLTPDAVHKLVSSENVAVEVVSCPRRFFADAEYEKVRPLVQTPEYL
jgi:alpha-aminoadipic semialdehyde synthase